MGCEVMRIILAALVLAFPACRTQTIIRHQNGVAAVETIGGMKNVSVLSDGSVKVDEITSPIDSIARTINFGMLGALLGL